jgi:hypothetical protein
VQGTIDQRAKVTGQVAFERATVIARADGTAVDMDAAEVGGSEFFRDQTQIHESLRLLKATLRGGLFGTTAINRRDFARPGARADLRGNPLPRGRHWRRTDRRVVTLAFSAGGADTADIRLLS